MYIRQTILNTIVSTLQNATGSYTSNIGNVIKISDGSQFDSSATLDAYIFPSETSYEGNYGFATAYMPVQCETNIDVVIYANNGSGSLSSVLTAIDDIYTCIGNNYANIVGSIPTLELNMKQDEIQIMNDDYAYVIGHLILNTKYKMQNFDPTGSL